jgi:hypothetical protein
MYMGSVGSVMRMLRDAHYMKSDLGKISVEYDDQGVLTSWYAENRDLVSLDTQSTLFRSIVTGRVDAAREGDWACGPGKRCGDEVTPATKTWKVSNDRRFTFLNKPRLASTKERCALEEIPFTLHGNGFLYYDYVDVRSHLYKLERSTPWRLHFHTIR